MRRPTHHAFTVAILSALIATTVAAQERAVEQRVHVLEEWVDEYEPGTAEGMVIGGALRFQYAYRDWNEGSRTRGGDVEFEVFRTNVVGRQGDMSFAAEYRWYGDFDTLHHGWIGWDFTDSLTGRLGVQQVPFGNLPYNSHSFFFSSGYYLGLEDDYDMGGTLRWDAGDWSVIGGFFKNDALGSASNARYSFDLVPTEDPDDCADNASDEHCQTETNQANLRIARTLTHGEDAATELGVSGQYGQMHNTGTRSNGDHWAVAAHIDGDYGPWTLMVQAARLEFDPELAPNETQDTVNLGAFATDWATPLESTVYTANVNYHLPITWGPVTEMNLYNNYSLVTDKNADFDDTHMNVTGVSVAAGNIFAYFDVIVAQNQPFIGGSMAEEGRDTNTRVNANIGYYF